MKLILTNLLLLCVTFAVAQKKGATMHDFEGLPGNWTGKMIFTSESDDKTETTLPLNLTISNVADSIELSISYTDANGRSVVNKKRLLIYNEGNQLFYGGDDYDVEAVRRLGDRLTVIAGREGRDNFKDADLRVTFIVGPGVLNIRTEVKYEGSAKYFTRNVLQLTKK